MLIFMALLSYDVVARMYRLMERAMENKALEQLAYVDALTACRNRTAFEKMMAQIDAASYPEAELVMFDINDFKYFNDHFGHRAGDEVLGIVVRCLKQAFEPCGSCYRIGGDEFMIIALEGIDRFDDRLTQLRMLLRQEGPALPDRPLLRPGRIFKRSFSGYLGDLPAGG